MNPQITPMTTVEQLFSRFLFYLLFVISNISFLRRLIPLFLKNAKI